ncbi:MAG TPA: 50S ribosomal protein L11 methyltransferase [Verrucomicrobiae bacterium]|jgi:ribosomal protein L11 methyltransferase|nr:50S ribosomal protein L11 methyltransferase [Verrucomicrobiae bacterium]
MEFWELTVPTTAETTEGLTNFLWEQGALGVVEEETPSAPPRLRAFYAASVSSTALLGAVEAYRAGLRAMQFVLGGDAEVHPIHDEQWASAWQQSFPPLCVGDRLFVAPPWEAAPTPAGRRRIVIEPGRAFGTGHHGSTESCLALLDRWLAAKPAGRVLDIGTGTGILAVAAVALGAPRVTAIDLDPDAISAARQNAAANGVGDLIDVSTGGPESLPRPAAYDLVLANILTHTHLALVREYRRRVAPFGALVLGGMLVGEDDQVTRALVPHGFTPRESLERDGWAASLMVRDHAT